ncbi:MAG: outer membrane beta-barrel protein, partial [Stellaceae bacterium]
MTLWRTTAAIGFAAAQVVFVFAHRAAAQTSELDIERQSVLQRARPDYDPLGAYVGSFLLYPSVDLSETYNSNVFVTPTDTKADLLTTISPVAQLRSNWNNDALNFIASGQMKRYATQVGENNTNALVGTDGRLDIERDVYFTGLLNYQLLHEDRASPNTVLNQKNPTEYQQASSDIGYVHESGRLGFRADGSVNYYTYNNNVTLTDTVIPETGRNRIEYSFGPRVSYEIIPGYQAFIQARGNYRQYMAEFDTSGLDATSRGYAVDAGTAVHLGPTLNGEVFVGWFAQDY